MPSKASRNGADMIDALPPHDPNAEMAVIGCMLQDGDAFARGVLRHKQEHFYTSKCGYTFEAMKKLFESGSMVVDVLVVADELRKMGKLDDVGGHYELTGMVAMVASPSWMIEQYSAIVVEKYKLRISLAIGIELEQMCRETRDGADQIISGTQDKLYLLASEGSRKHTRTANEIAQEVLTEIEKHQISNKTLLGLPTKFSKLDEMTSGLLKTDLIIIAGRPGMGKTGFSLSLAKNLSIDQGIPGGIISLEMSGMQLMMRLIANIAGLDHQLIRRLKVGHDEIMKVVMVQQKIAESPLYIDDSPSMTISQIRAKIQIFVSQNKAQYVILDYLGLIKSDERRNENRVVEVSRHSNMLKAIAKEYEIPFIVVSQLSRETEKRDSKRPQLSDLRDSGAIEQDADHVWFMYRPEYYKMMHDGGQFSDAPEDAELIIAKQRNGPTGTIGIQFQPKFVRFVDKYHGSTNGQIDDYNFREEEFVQQMPF